MSMLDVLYGALSDRDTRLAASRILSVNLKWLFSLNSSAGQERGSLKNVARGRLSATE